jgi:hypothetical protein
LATISAWTLQFALADMAWGVVAITIVAWTFKKLNKVVF